MGWSVYEAVPEGFDFNTTFPTWIIAFCPDTDSWFVTNQRFFYYEYEKEFATKGEGIAFFKNNPNIFYEKELQMKVYRPSFYQGGVFLDDINELVKL